MGDTDLRIVVAEEQVQLRDFFEVALPHVGCKAVHFVSSVPELEEICKRTRPDLVVCSLQFGGSDAFVIRDKVHQICPVPFLVTVAELHSQLAPTSEDDASCQVYSGPFDVGSLRSAIQNAVSLF